MAIFNSYVKLPEGKNSEILGIMFLCNFALGAPVEIGRSTLDSSYFKLYDAVDDASTYSCDMTTFAAVTANGDILYEKGTAVGSLAAGRLNSSIWPQHVAQATHR